MTFAVPHFQFDTIRDDLAELRSGLPSSPHPGQGHAPSAPTGVPAGAPGGADDALLARLRAGDETALEEVFDQYLEPLVRFADATLGTSGGAAGDAGDVVSDVLVALWERRGALGDVHNLRGYLYRAVRNRALNRRRSERRGHDRHAVLAAGGDAPGMSAAPVAPDVRVEDAERQRAVWDAVRALREPVRTVAVLRWSHGLSFAEIAAVVGTTDAVARAHASRALAALRAALPDLLR